MNKKKYISPAATCEEATLSLNILAGSGSTTTPPAGGGGGNGPSSGGGGGTLFD